MIEHDNGYDPYNSATTRKAPPIPDWLRNDPAIEAFAHRLFYAALERHGLLTTPTRPRPDGPAERR